MTARAWVDPNNNNRVSVWLNNYKKTGAFTWTYLAGQALVLNCPEKRGVGIHDLARWFWERITQFKKAESIDRANILFGNVNGFGGDDMIWIDKFTGDATAYINDGKMDTDGSNWWFLKSGKQSAGSWAGTCQYFLDLDGDGRADLHSIMNSFTNRGETFFNRCSMKDATGDDAGWEPGRDQGFGALPAAPSDDKPTNGGNVPALSST
ncbi:hypothetical protein LCI18_003762 [Fusarium solani-melongenae]|uniref:Uncharacterized protein n=1 Tax=Fusarium solani subsp. cucurbitae TaxID=2747967 RepID=A0ACD3YVC1_FUSSC|nr:hypothetical protein LCI18_003762 [Fusarium solani-melongenae]